MGKKYTAGITEKRLNNRRFRKTEEAILRVFFEKDVFIGTKEMAAKVGVARSTFYRHHRATREIVPDYKKYILRKYTRMINKTIRQRGANPKVIYAKTLVFILRNRVIFEMLLKSDGVNIVRDMIGKLEEDFTKEMRLLRGARKVFAVYASEVTEIINEWCNDGFKEKEIGKVLDNIVYLTETAKKRLEPIA